MISFLLILLTFISPHYHRQNDVEGTWVRFGDGYAGMMIAIQEEEGSMTARLIHIPEDPYQAGFMFNDIKWKNITKESPDHYTHYDLYITRETYVRSYKKTNLYFISPDTLTTSLIGPSDAFIGIKQKWVRLSSK